MRIQQCTRSLWRALAIALVCSAVLTLGQIAPAQAASCIVTSTGDSGAGTLRQCLLGAGQGDAITFDPTVFPPGAPATINLVTPLPAMAAGGVTIDAANAGVKVNGAGIGQADAGGIVLASSNNAIYGLHLHAFPGWGIAVQSGANDNRIGGALPGQRNIVDLSGIGAILILGNGNQVSGNWIGTEDGVTLPGEVGNAGTGVEVAGGAQRNSIGGDQPGQGNVIVGSLGFGVAIHEAGTMSNTVAGNYIGLNAAGTATLGNGWGGVLLFNGATANVVGGAASGARNYIAGNTGHGVIISGVGTDFNQLLGNYIGTDVSGAIGFGNAGHGVLVEGGAQDTIIGSGATTRNLISANRDAGIRIESAGTDRTIVRGNFIGVNAAGTAALGNGDVGVDVREAATYVQIGGSGAGEGNVISGNGFDGVRLLNSGVTSNTITGNIIGLNAAGAASLPNAGNGVWIGGEAAANIVGGVTEGARNTISGNNGAGVSLENTYDNRVSGNYIGLDAQGVAALGNDGPGISLQNTSIRNLIGGYTPGERNAIGANAGEGIRLGDSGVTSNTIAGNYIGLNAVGTANMGNDYNGVWIGDGATANVVGGDADRGARNYISGNKGNGVTIRGSATAFNVVSGNSIGLDVDGTRAVYIQTLVLAPNFPANPTLWVGSENNGVWKSADGGAHWAAANNGLPEPDVRALAVAPSGELFAGTANGVFKSTDGGANWVDVSPAGDLAVVALVVSPNYAADHTVVAAAEEYLQVSTDGGATWQLRIFGSEPGWIMTLAISPAFATDHTLFAGTDASEIFKSVDGGATWTEAAGPWAAQGRVRALGMSPAYGTDQTIFAGIFFGGGIDIGIIYRSTDGGASWGETGGQPAQVMRSFGFSPAYGAGDQTLFVGDASRGVFRSTDGGASWQNTLAELNGKTIAVSPNFGVDGTVFVGSDPAGIFRSQDRGVQWVPFGDLTEQGNGGSGVELTGGAHDNVIGGATAGERNLISHNGDAGVDILDVGTTANRVIGNYIGVSSDGLTAVGNGDSGVEIHMDASANTVGGSTAGERNIISGNRSDGVWLRGSEVNSNTVIGNYIGVDVTGMHGLGNQAKGIYVGNNAAFNRIGGSAPGERNVVSGNGHAGVSIDDAHHNYVLGNYVGVAANGAAALPNAWNGIALGEGAQANQIGGAIAGAGNLISGNQNYGVALYDAGTMYNVVMGNRIGTDAAGNLAIPNQEFGIELRGGPALNIIGGINPTAGSSCTGACNLISGNGSGGVLLIDQETMSNTVSGNYIGTDLAGSVALPNADGVRLEYGASHNMIGGAATGAGNLIAYNTAAGVLVNDATTLANTLTRNFVYSNTQTGIDLANGGNAELAAPAFITVTNSGTVVGTACANCTVEVFSDAAGQGRVFEGSVVANAAGQFTFQATRLLTGPQLTATATDASGNTSEFSSPFVLPAQISRVYLPVVKK